MVTLARYFPRAWVLGVDLNLRNIKVARRRFPNPQWEFHLSTDANIESRAPFDAVFCLSVLQKTGMRKLQPGENGSDIYPFAKYERQISQLDRWLVPGGLLVIHNSNYRFCDCDMAFNYEVLPKPPGLLLHGMQFDQEGNRLGEIPYEGVFFRKLNPNFD